MTRIHWRTWGGATASDRGLNAIFTPTGGYGNVISDGGWADSERGVQKIRELRELEIPVVHIAIGMEPLDVEASAVVVVRDPADAMDIIAADTVTALQARRRR